MGRGSIFEVICQRGDPMENVLFGGYYWGIDGLVAEFHCIGDFFGLGVFWYKPLSSIMV